MLVNRSKMFNKKTLKKAMLLTALAGGLVGSSVLSGCGTSANLPGAGVTELTKNPTAVVCLSDADANLDEVKNFTFELFDESLNMTNPVISPVSAYMAMSMTRAGAAGTTAEEFQNLFSEHMVQNVDTLLDMLPEDEETLTVNIANSAWVDDGFTAKEDWIALISEYYESEVFQTDLPGAMKSINNWVEDKTEGLIDAIIDQPLENHARLVLLNAIYFKGKWVMPFAAAVTAVTDEAGSAAPMEEPIDVFFDEPFLYMIYDTETGIPLFIGILDEPVK